MKLIPFILEMLPKDLFCLMCTLIDYMTHTVEKENTALAQSV